MATITSPASFGPSLTRQRIAKNGGKPPILGPDNLDQFLKGRLVCCLVFSVSKTGKRFAVLEMGRITYYFVPNMGDGCPIGVEVPVKIGSEITGIWQSVGKIEVHLVELVS